MQPSPSHFFWTVGALCIFGTLQAISASTADSQPIATSDHVKAMIDWVRASGGFVSDKLEIRRRDPNDEFSPMGVFASEAVQEDERLLEVPRQCYISLQAEEIKDADLYGLEGASMDDIMVAYYANTCRFAHKIMEEMNVYRNNPDKSKFGPFLAYLETVPMGQLPATYTPESKAILRDIMGPITEIGTKRGNTSSGMTTFTREPMTSKKYGNYSLPPWQLADWIDIQFRETGCIPADDKEAEHAVAMAIQRGYDSELIPIWDMFNHDNGKLNVDTNSIRSEGGVKVWADKDIAAGEELFATYNYCVDCYDVGDDWGTPGIFRDFGFIEGYPQVWPLLDHDIYFEVDYDEEDKKRLKARFDIDEKTGQLEYVPDAKGLAFLREQLERLTDLDLSELRGDLKIPPQEWAMTQEYHQALVVALTLGIEATLNEMYPERREGQSNEL